MKNQPFELFYSINEEIKKGQKVKLYDGSSLSLKEDESYSNNEEYYIINAYINLGFDKPLQEYEFNVLEVEIKNRVGGGRFSDDYSFIYLQDILIECNGIKFRTASNHVCKVEQTNNK